MFFIMIIAGLLSTMNVWADKWEDVRLSLNDVYMILLMTGWMLLFMGILNKFMPATLVGLLLVLFNLYAIRNQLFVNQKQYLLGMIPHHSMAVLMSKEMLKKENNIQKLLTDIIAGQEKEIQYMKDKLVSTTGR